MLSNLNWADLGSCIAARWSPQIGDPHMTGWLTVLAYVACMVLATAVWRRTPDGTERGFWALLAVLMALLAINKQLDLQSALTALGRCVAKLQGWYDERRVFQRHFIEGLLVASLMIFAFGLYLMRHHLRRNSLALMGLTVVAGFVAVRAVGFHHFDALINTKVQDLRFNFIFETSGLILIALNAVVLLARLRRG